MTPSTALLDSERWKGKLFTGSWQATAHVSDVVEPATGQRLGQVGIADAEHVGPSADQANQAQQG